MNFQEKELEILRFWKEHKIYEKSRRKGTPYYFLDGPPYTSGKVHLGTAWNKCLKDMVLRYKRMQGFDVFDRAGYDMHGLPTEHAVQKKLKLEGKKEIESFGVGKFVEECRQLCVENMQAMNKSFDRLGVWMDFTNAYQSITDEFIEGVWWFIHRAHEKNRLYEGLRSMTWCPDCATALAKHECEYKTVNDKSIFVKFPVKGEENTYLIIWTTTPWTIPFNLAIMVHPELPYQRCKVTKDGVTETWILSSALAGPVIQSVADATYEVEKEFPGEQLAGMQYVHPFHKELIHFRRMQLEHPNIHTVVLSTEYVDTTSGSGLVHCAPGCGPEDYEVGVQNNLPAFNVVDEQGVFPEEMTLFAGKRAKTDDTFFISMLEERDALVASVPIEHEYAHCWRCHSPVIWKATKQWFFKVEDIKEQLVAENNKISWVPEAGYNAFDSWLKNLRDNSITKQRYWGVPLPIWRCTDCENYVVIDSKETLRAHVGANMPQELHKPWIDDVTWACACKGEMQRIPDVLDVWVDAGSAAWNALGYPQQSEQFKQLYPADFILEGKDQVRGWFNLLHIASMIAFEQPSFKAVYMHGFINDAQGRKMSKSLGNYILPEEVVDKYGASTFRYYAIGAANPGLDMNYNFEEVELKHRNLLVLWNLRSLVTTGSPGDLREEDKYILSRLHSTIKAVTDRMDRYILNEVPHLIEQLFLDLSRKYIQLVRDRMQEDTTVAYVLRTVYVETLKLFSIVVPFFAEDAYQHIRTKLNLEKESIHLYDWPKFDEGLIDTKLESRFERLFDFTGAILAARDKVKLGVRWPVQEVILPKDLEGLEELFKQQVNVKTLRVGTLDSVRVEVKPNFRNLAKKFGKETGDVARLITEHTKELGEAYQNDAPLVVGPYNIDKEHLESSYIIPEHWEHAVANNGTVYLCTKLTPELEQEGLARELARRVQQERKNAGLQKEQRINLGIRADVIPETFDNDIGKKTGAIVERVDDVSLFAHTHTFTVRGHSLSFGFTLL